VNSTVMADPTSEETTARSASLVVLGDTWLTTFGTNPRGGNIGREVMRCHTRLVQTGHPRRRTTATRSGRVRVMTVDSPGEASTAGPPGIAAARIDEMISRSDIVKLSDGDLAWLRPGDRHADSVRWLMSRGPAILIVTHGRTAATGYTRRGVLHAHGPAGVVVDTAKWENAFAAGLLNALTGRDLLTWRGDRNLRALGLDDLREILHDANLSAVRAATSATAPTGSCANKDDW
jgi:sugar/nucleoside kinase (ribokinase family)